jgi:NTE family protein
MNEMDKHRALVLQGGGSLGAYEAGVYQALYEKVSQADRENGRPNKPIFDAIAGTSIGAINAAVLVSHVVENGTWEGSAEKLGDFWEYLSAEPVSDMNPFFAKWWDYLHQINEGVASGEAARRYYATKQFGMSGVSNVFLPLPPLADDKFFDPMNMWFRYDNDPLKKSLERFVKFPIATSFDKGQPRLLLVAVDVQEGMPVLFDSYEQSDGSRKSEYGKFVVGRDGREVGFKHVIRYDEGIKAEHVMASASFPVNFAYSSIEVDTLTATPSAGKAPGGRGEERFQYQKGVRYFWDGGLLTNTPLSHLVVAHRNFWYRVRGFKDTVPPLVICIVNLHPIEQEHVPWDHDGVINRKDDITFRDRTLTDESMALLITDYVNMARDLIRLAKANGVKEDEIRTLLMKNAESRDLIRKMPRKYKDLLEGRFVVEKVVRVERKNDSDTISSKTYDFSSKTIRHLRERGYLETLEEYDRIKNGTIYSYETA